MRSLIGHARPVRALAYAPGPIPLLATASDDRTVRLWNPATGEQVGDLQKPRGLVSLLAFSDDATRLASAGRAGILTIWELADGNRPDVEQLFRPVVGLSFVNGGRAVIAGLASTRYGTVGMLVCVNLVPFHPCERLDWRGDVEVVAICPSRDVLAIGGHNRSVELLEVGRPRQEPAFWMPSRVRALAFSPGDGRYLAVAGGKRVGIWDVESRQWRSQCVGHKGDVKALAFSPDGLTLLSGGMDRSVRLFETLSGRQLEAWEWKVGVVHALAYATDGMTAAVAGEKSQVVVWDVDEG